MKLHLGIVQKLTAIFVLFAAGLLAGLGLLAYNSGRASLQAATTAELLSTALEKQAALNTWVQERQGGVANLANYPHLVDETSALVSAAPGSPDVQPARDALVQDLNQLAGPGQAYLDLMLLDPITGMVLASTNPVEEGQFHENLPYFIEGKNGPYVQNLYFSMDLQAPAMTASAPIRSTDGRLLGVLAGQMNLDEMNAIVSRRSGLQQTDDALLVTTSNLFATQPRFLPDPAVLQRGVHTAGVNACLAHNSGVLLFADYRGVPVIGVYRWLPERQLCLIVKVDQAEAFAPARALGETILFTGLLALLAATALSVWLARTITRPILALQAGATRLGQGDLSQKVEVNTRDELGQLAGAFNRMALSLATRAQENTQLFEALRQSHADLEQRVQERTADLARANETLVAEMAERQLAQAALARSEENYRTLFELATDGIFIADPQGRYIDVNSSGCQMLGYTREEILQRSMAELVAPDDQAQTPLLLPELRAGRDVMSERQMICRDGRLLSVEISGRRLPDGRFQGIVRDITARKRAEVESQAVQARLRFYVDANMIGVVRENDLGKLIEVNDYYLNLLGFTRQEYEAGLVDWKDRTPPEYLPANARAIAELKERGVCRPYEKEYYRKDGSRVWVYLSNALMPDGTIAAYVLDITERKQAEAALAGQREDLARSNAELEQFAYVASHDLQEPLRMVSSYVKLLARRYQGQLDPKADKYIAYSVEGATRMQALINDLLAYSRVGTRGKPLAPASCDLVLDRALANLEIAIRESGAVIVREPLPNVPGDEVQLVQLFQNLVGNAIKFRCADQPPHVEIGAQREGGEWVFAIRDNGIGIAPQHIERIFVIFQRLHTRDEYPGTGMGLAICKKIVERHSGRIWVESEPGQGSTFYFTLPETGGH